MPHFNGTKTAKQPSKKIVKPSMPDEMGYAKLQYNVPKGVEDDKRIKPSQVFVGFVDKNKKKVTKQNKKKKG
tara:strand:+ start:2780 stop:2995 length:216 start_codon:yes stop_codon:yes gene_type:complete